jgi:hypothetical protein
MQFKLRFLDLHFWQDIRVRANSSISPILAFSPLKNKPSIRKTSTKSNAKVLEIF